ncbi:hypothetical protein VNO78_20621 [Psophocarpus tetragonolobus]|uniref:Uncharacterized protein n=1 Tax=Psophocarpus tetragonolobus TaxID=3891 RepID=A0AAN9SAP9_PSOTE
MLIRRGAQRRGSGAAGAALGKQRHLLGPPSITENKKEIKFTFTSPSSSTTTITPFPSIEPVRHLRGALTDIHSPPICFASHAKPLTYPYDMMEGCASVLELS